MAKKKIPKIKRVDEKKNYYHIRFREPSLFSSIRIPAWASVVANSVSKGAKVKTGTLKTTKRWKIQSIMIKKKGHNKISARRLARKIVKKIELR